MARYRRRYSILLATGTNRLLLLSVFGVPFLHVVRAKVILGVIP